MSASVLIWGLVFGSIGSGYFIYGKKQNSFIPMLCGMALIAIPYFITNTILLVLAGVVLAVVPFVIRG